MLNEAKVVRHELVVWLGYTWGDWPPAAERVILGLDAYILNNGNVTPGFLRGLADDVTALAAHAHPQ